MLRIEKAELVVLIILGNRLTNKGTIMKKAINITFCFINTPIVALVPSAGTRTRLVSPFLFSCC